MVSRLLLAVVVVMIGWPESLQAQGMRRGAQPAANLQPTDIEGFIQGVTQGGVFVLDGNNQHWQVSVPPMAKVQVTGEANADYLQSGMIVEFKADIDEHGAVNEKVDKLSIITIFQDKQMGLFPPSSVDEPPGFGPDAGMGGGSKPAKRSPGKAASGAVAAGSYRIVGRLMVARNGKMSANTGRGVIAFEMTQQPDIAVNVADYSVATKGDKVKIKGGTMPGKAGMAQANDVKIELSQPLAGAKKKGPPAKSEGKRSSKRPKKQEGLPEPADEK